MCRTVDSQVPLYSTLITRSVLSPWSSNLTTLLLDGYSCYLTLDGFHMDIMDTSPGRALAKEGIILITAIQLL